MFFSVGLRNLDKNRKVIFDMSILVMSSVTGTYMAVKGLDAYNV